MTIRDAVTRRALPSSPGLGLWSRAQPGRASGKGGRTEKPISTSDPTQDLLLRCAAGDRSAFRALYAAQAGRLYGLALRVTHDPGLAADAVQDAFMLVWRRSATFDAGRGTAQGWLAALVRYRAIDIVRGRGREQVGAERRDEASGEPDALERLQASAEGAALRACLDQLPADRRDLLVLAFTDGLTHAELAQKRGEPLGTVKARIRRSLLALKHCLDP